MHILVLPCDGIGPEITAAAMSVLNAADSTYGLGFSFDHDDVGFPRQGCRTRTAAGKTRGHRQCGGRRQEVAAGHCHVMVSGT